MWGELKAPWDPQQHYLGLSGVRSMEHLPSISLPCTFYLQEVLKV